MQGLDKIYGTFANRQRDNNYTTTFSTFTILGLMLLGTFIGLDIAMIGVGVQHTNTTCDNGYHINRLSPWLITFGSGNLVMIGLFLFYSVIIARIASKDSKILGSSEIILGLIWTVFTVTMIIMGIIELVHVLPECVVEEHTLSAMVLLSVILELFFMCVALLIFKYRQ